MWQLKHSDKRDFYLAMEERTGITPEPLLNEPDFSFEVVWYLDAFFMLSDSRNIGGEVCGSIPLSEITNYSNYFELIDDLMMFCQIIRQTDIVYVNHTNKKKPKVSEPKQK